MFRHHRLAGIAATAGALAGLVLAGATAATAAAASPRAPGSPGGIGRPVAAPPGRAGPTRCTGRNSYDLTAPTLAACGIATYPAASASRLRDGGTMVTYRSGAQTVFAVTPPRGESLITAPQSVRDLYGLPGPPPRRAAGSAVTLASWRRELRSLRWAPAPAALHDVPGVAFGDTPESWPAWTGYTVNESTGYFHYAYLHFVEPARQPATCDPNGGAVFWTGLGGVNNSDLGQDGTAQGQFNGLAQNQGWIETDVGPVTASTVSATVGKQMSVTTIYEPDYNNTGKGAYIYNFDNLATGASQSLGTWDSHYSGATADWIAERPETSQKPLAWEDLSGFGTMQFTWAAAAVQQYPVSHYPYSNWEMYDGWDMADSSALSGNGYSFTATHHHCNQGS